MSPMTRFFRRSEKGAVASIVGLLLGMGVILGFAAVSIDVGSLMWERRQLQNGADAAALALARTCAEEPAECTAGNGTTAAMLQTYNNSNNNKDDAGTFNVYPQGACGNAIPTLPPCNPPTGALTDCPPLPPVLAANPAIPYVEVHTLTQETGGGTILPTWVAHTLTGTTPEDAGTEVEACARVAFGAGGTVSSLPITLSMCEWRANTGSGTDYVDEDPEVGQNPGYGGPGQPAWPTPAEERRIVMQDPPNPASISPPSCTNFNGHDVPGGFGYLEQNQCQAVIDQYNYAHVKPGNSIQSCDIESMIGTIVYLPVFDCTVDEQPTSAVVPSDCDDFDGNAGDGSGSNTWYHIAGWAKFYLSGEKTSGSANSSILPGSTLACTGPNRCIYGWFLDGELVDVPVAGPPPPLGSPGFGSYVIQPAG
jgi:hypothetical protein